MLPSLATQNPNGEEPDSVRSENLRFEYEMAQKMLCHYDTLNWQIGAILVVGALAMTGLVIDRDLLEFIGKKTPASYAIAFGIPLMTLSVLLIWAFWFVRHARLYDYRNEVFHRIEPQLGIYHYLRVLETNPIGDPKNDKKRCRDYCAEAKRRAGYADEDEEGSFHPLKSLEGLPGVSGKIMSFVLAIAIPLGQLVVFASALL